jgi:hypothetical protein
MFCLSPPLLLILLQQKNHIQGEPHREFAAITTGKNPEERMILTLRYLIFFETSEAVLPVQPIDDTRNLTLDGL